MPIKLKRAYDPPAPGDGLRILLERLWPRGLTKEAAALDEWTKDVSPSPNLRKWFAHDPSKWDAFKDRYREELRANPDGIARLRALVAGKTATFVYAAKDPDMNSALLLKAFIEGERQ
ncbi:MAG: DUF488 family protein [Alphaproteobacteria bacterium]|nr:DUF488 family protein [Alphaproteobacteria bacterium]